MTCLTIALKRPLSLSFQLVIASLIKEAGLMRLQDLVSTKRSSSPVSFYNFNELKYILQS